MGRSFLFRSWYVIERKRKSPQKFIILKALLECRRRDSNPHASRRHPLKMVCLPIPPLRLLEKDYLDFSAGAGFASLGAGFVGAGAVSLPAGAGAGVASFAGAFSAGAAF